MGQSFFLNPTSGMDGNFLVRTKDKEEQITGHKAMLANGSCVFYDMFFGSIPEEGDEIKVPDIHPETFRTMLHFLYTGEIEIISVEDAVQVWYAAHKYNIKKLTQYTINYLKNNVTPKNVCYILEFAIAFENETVMNFCKEIIVEDTSTVLNDPSFLETDLLALNFILDQNELTISEIDLFKALVRYDDARKNINEAKSVQPSSTSPVNSESDDLNEKEISVSDGNLVGACGEGSASREETETHGSNPLRELVKKIRFLTMTPEECSECLGMSSLLSESEVLSIMFNISTRIPSKHPMPEGFSKIKDIREHHQGNDMKTYPYFISGPITQTIVHATPINLPRYINLRNQNYEKKYYSYHAVLNYSNLISWELEGFLYFQTNIHILLTGVQVVNPTVNRDTYNNVVTPATCTIQIMNARKLILLKNEVTLSYVCDSFVEIPLKCPVYINARRNFIISVKFEHVKIICPEECSFSCKVNNVIFQFKKLN